MFSDTSNQLQETRRKEGRRHIARHIYGVVVEENGRVNKRNYYHAWTGHSRIMMQGNIHESYRTCYTHMGCFFLCSIMYIKVHVLILNSSLNPSTRKRKCHHLFVSLFYSMVMRLHEYFQYFRCFCTHTCAYHVWQHTTAHSNDFRRQEGWLHSEMPT